MLSQLSGTASPEGELARDAFASRHGDIANVVAASASGRELIENGWAEGVSIATQLDVSTTAPVLIDQAYVPTPPSFES